MVEVSVVLFDRQIQISIGSQRHARDKRQGDEPCRIIRALIDGLIESGMTW